MGKAPVYFSETITIGRNTYLLEVKRNQRGQKYFLITSTSAPSDDPCAVLVFSNSMERFRKLIDRAAQAVHTSVAEIEPLERSWAPKPTKRSSTKLATKPLSNTAAPARREAKKDRPQNQGRRWTAEHDSQLIANHEKGVSVDALASLLGRGKFSIEVRLVKLGLHRKET